MEIDLYGLISVMAAFIFVAITGILFKLKMDKTEKAMQVDYEKEHEIKGIVDEVVVMPYIPSDGLYTIVGFIGTYSKEEQTLVVFEDGSRITIKGLHPEIKKGENWIIKYRGTDEWFLIKPLIEKKKF